MDRRTRPVEETEVRFIGVNVPVPLYQELRGRAFEEGTSATQLVRKAIVRYLDKVKK
jgi:hypothetical protein